MRERKTDDGSRLVLEKYSLCGTHGRAGGENVVNEEEMRALNPRCGRLISYCERAGKIFRTPRFVERCLCSGLSAPYEDIVSEYVARIMRDRVPHYSRDLIVPTRA